MTETDPLQLSLGDASPTVLSVNEIVDKNQVWHDWMN